MPLPGQLDAGPDERRCMPAHLILGGARSGKSRRALSLAEKAAPRRVLIATAEALDDEMAERIARHRSERGVGWETVEAPLALAEAIRASARPETALVVDCLTLWLTKLLLAGRDCDVATRELLAVLETHPGFAFFVSNEVGLGLVPETPLGRIFRDAQGRLNQEMADACAVVEFIAAGLPLRLKG